MTVWAHSPLHIFGESDTFIVTCGTYGKEHLFLSPDRLDILQEQLLLLAEESAWNLQAWALMCNHYHFVGVAPGAGRSLPDFLRRLHSKTAIAVNKLDSTPGRRVWFQYWDTQITSERSYLARLKYVHENPVHHGLVADARQYRWCSANWFALNAERSFYETVYSFKIDKVKVQEY